MSTQKDRIGLLLSDGLQTIRHCDEEHTVRCSITFDLGRASTLIVDVLDPLPMKFHETHHKPFFVVIPNAEPVECFVTRSQLRIGAESGILLSLTPRHSNITINSGEPLVRVNAGIVNFAQFWINGPTTSGFALRWNEWIFEFTLVDQCRIMYPPVIQNDDYFFTHHLVLHKTDWSSFTAAEANEKLDSISHFLTFCHEHWVSPALVSGMSVGGVVSFEQWGTRFLSPWQTGNNWMDRHHGETMFDVFPLFMARLEDPTWKETLRKVLYWYVRADTGYVGSDGAIILLQAALELVSWHVLVQDRAALSEAGFARLTAADQLRLLLNVCKLPAQIPTGLSDLQTAAKRFNWCDGPETFVGARNRLVHPPKKARHATAIPYYDAYLLGKWYLELVLLHEIGYSGVYGNRTKRQRWMGEVEPVPWA